MVFASAASKADPKGIKSLWSRVAHRMFSLEPNEKRLGLGKEVNALSFFNDTFFYLFFFFFFLNCYFYIYF